MKTLFVLLLSCLTVSAQNLAVSFYGPNPDGIPTNWPCGLLSLGTNTSVPAGWTLMSRTQYDAYLAANRPAYDAWESNKTYVAQAPLKEKIAALVSSYSNLQWVADNFASVTNIATIRIALKATGEVLLDLKPVLIELYRP